MTVQGKTDAKPILEAETKQTQPLLDQAWKDWEHALEEELVGSSRIETPEVPE